MKIEELFEKYLKVPCYHNHFELEKGEQKVKIYCKEGKIVIEIIKGE